MTSSRCDSKGSQTDQQNPSKWLKTLQIYINAVSQYRLYLFNQYTQSNDSYENQDLVNVRKEILHRFQLVIDELEQTLENLQRHQLSDTDVHRIVNRSFMKEVIETSLKANLTSTHNQKQPPPNIEEWRIYRRALQEIKEDLQILNFLVHRGITRIDRLVNVTNLYV